MHIPTSTYRLQFSHEFTFNDLKDIIDYLENFNISTIYAAPFFQSMEGSTHGYDVVNPFVINKKIGDLETFREISSILKKKNISWLQDIVPNHMANSPANPWIKNILEMGPSSPYYQYFDINWNYKEWEGKVMTPVLGDTLDNILNTGELELIINEEGFQFKYYDNIYPASGQSYYYILSKGSGAEDDEWFNKFKQLSDNLSQWEEIKKGFYHATEKHPVYKDKINSVLETINGSKDQMLHLLDLQFFHLTHWKESEKKINFRRFFTINDLICLRIEDQEVFQAYHKFIHQLCKEGLISGLRIDHIDGLYDPKGYLEDLSNLMNNDFYVIIEKILEAEEDLPKNWKTQGTSGYDFLAMINNLYTDTNSGKTFNREYEKIKPEVADYQQLVYEKKQYILHENMGGELQNLWTLLEDLHLLPDWLNKEKGIKAFSALLSSFPVYRIYPEKFPLTKGQNEIVDIAYNGALKQEPGLSKEVRYFRNLFLGKEKEKAQEQLLFLKRCQQFTGPLAAKGVEDTSFYLYNRLISHNEVGDSPEEFGISIKKFHTWMEKRREEFPLAINETSTHDTKRGEDARMRINVISEMPEEWFAKVEEWHTINQKVRKNDQVPDMNEEYFIYQTLIGGMPFDNELEDDFLDRTNAFLQKALREAKEHTNWSDPNEEFENAVAEFVSDIINHDAFRSTFDEFRVKVSFYGVINSLGQSLIKVMAPGIPDIYQGSELWDLSYVDPDNRRPVDYGLRIKYLNEFIEKKVQDDYLKQLMENYPDGRIKMYVLYHALKARRMHPEIFENGEYIPLELSSGLSEKVISFARRYQDQWYIIAAPLNGTRLSISGFFATGELWGEGHLKLPDIAPQEWYNIYNGDDIASTGQIQLIELFRNFPVALLKSRK